MNKSIALFYMATNQRSKLVTTLVNVRVSSKSHYGVPMHFLWGKISDSSGKKQLILSELNGNYMHR